MKTKKLILGVGINDADYVVKKHETIGYVGGKRKQKLAWECPFYSAWKSMLARCYSAKYQERQPTYVGCTVSDSWLTFTNFKNWMGKQDWEVSSLIRIYYFKATKYIALTPACLSHKR